MPLYFIDYDTFSHYITLTLLMPLLPIIIDTLILLIIILIIIIIAIIDIIIIDIIIDAIIIDYY
jgi:hypothetical protein